MNYYEINPEFRPERIFDKYYLVSGKHARKSNPLLIPLNEQAVAVWRGLEQDKSLEDIAGQICDQYAVDFDRAMDDTKTFCRILCQHGYLLEKSGDV